MPKKAQPENLYPHLIVESLVKYYLEGWRYGYLKEVKGRTAKVQPIAAYKGVTPNTVKVPADDVSLA